MGFISIRELSSLYGVSSRTLRYYEEVGLLWSEHPNEKPQRYYDADALERLKQIVVLRKLQIPIKDIQAIFNSSDTAALMQAFTAKLNALDEEITSLSDLRLLVEEFLQKINHTGTAKLSAIPLLYEEAKRSLAIVRPRQPVSMDRLESVGRRAKRLHDVRTIRLPTMRMLTSIKKNGHAEPLDSHTMQHMFTPFGVTPIPGLRQAFLLKKRDVWTMAACIPEDFDNVTPYRDIRLAGGLYAVATSWMEDLQETFDLLKDHIAASDAYMLDINTKGGLKRAEMAEELMPWDIAVAQNRYQQDVYLPIRLKEEVNHE